MAENLGGLRSALLEAGFSPEQVTKLLADSHFSSKHARHDSGFFKARFAKIVAVYGITEDYALKAVFKFPPFASYDHARVVEGICGACGLNKNSEEDRRKVAKAVFKHPPFAALKHARVLAGFRDTFKRFFGCLIVD